MPAVMPVTKQPTAAGPSSAGTTASAAELLQLLFAPVSDELKEVEGLLKAELSSQHPFVNELVSYGCMLGGKRLRPALLLLTAKAVSGTVKPAHLTLATVVEMIHTATLVHDDVLDEAVMRRHLATVNARWDNEASVLLGDFLFTHAFYLASTLDNVIGCRLIGRATNTVCEGELRQKGSRGNFGLSEQEYLEIIEAKTAELTAVSCRLGALFAAPDESVAEQMDGFGRDLGIAFQIADDLLDVQGEEKTTGKSLGTDLEKQKPTLPIIYTLKQATAADRESMLDILTSDARRPDLLQPFLSRYRAIEYTRSRAKAFSERAKRRLECISPNAARDTLSLMTDFVINRSM
jgi:octaprenyl-diphosphate synthase